jgi:hypothetical protein
MRIVAVMGVAVIAASCAPKFELMEGNSNAPLTASSLAQSADEIKTGASATQTARPVVRNARSSSFRAQTVSAHNEGIADAQNDLTVPAPRRQSNVVTPATTVASSVTTQHDGEAATQGARTDAVDRAPEKASDSAQETVLNQGFLQASACVRNNIKAAYRSSETVDQATSFLMRRRFGPFSAAVASDEASATTLFKGLVFQEISPEEWLAERAAQGR